MKEVWRLIVGYETRYEVSNLGRVRFLFTKAKARAGAIKRPRVSKTGYCAIQLSRGDNKYRTYLVHRLVAEAFIPNPEHKPDVNHIDSNRTNNQVCNLEWATKLENSTHGRIHGRIGQDGRRRWAKLSPNQVGDIKGRLMLGESPSSIARDYPVGATTICEIGRGRSWRHV